MSTKLRSVNTRFWDDPFIEELNPSEKLLFLYLITNPLTNLLGIYEITIKRIAYDTGLNQETIRKGLERFATIRKAYFIKNYIILPNWIKNQNLNANMKVAVEREYHKLPDELKIKFIWNGSEGFGNGSEGLGNDSVIEIEREDEIEVEKERGRRKFTPPSIDEIKQYCLEKKYTVDAGQFFNFYSAKGWKIGKNTMQDWKAAVNTWQNRNNEQNGRTKKNDPNRAKQEGYMAL